MRGETLGDEITLFIPAFDGPQPLSESVSTILNLQVWRTLRKSHTSVSIGKADRGRVVWDSRTLSRYSHDAAENVARSADVLAQLVLWGRVYEFGPGAVVQAQLSIPLYEDFREEKPEIWTVRIAQSDGDVVLSSDIPQRRYSFEPIILMPKILALYSRPNALLMYSTEKGNREIGKVGNIFTALELGTNSIKVRSNGRVGWVRLPELSHNRTEVMDFVAGVLRIFRADWEGAVIFMRAVIDNTHTPNELRTDAFLYTAFALSQLGKSSEEFLRAAHEISPFARRVIVYWFMAKLAEYKTLKYANRLMEQRQKEILIGMEHLIQENLYLFDKNDAWLMAAREALQKLATEEGDTPAALTTIADAADRICGIVATQGGTHSSRISGDVHAELNGLVRQLAAVGVSGAGQIESSDYQNVLQQDLSTALRDVRDCKLRVFERLVVTVLPGVIVPSGAGAPSGTLLQSPLSAHLVEFIRDYWGTELGLHSCSNAASGQAFNIICYGIVTRTAQGQHNFRIDALFPGRTKLVDNFHIEHRLRRGVFINGMGGRQQTANLSTGESIWWELEFEPGLRRASSARIVIDNLKLRSPVY